MPVAIHLLEPHIMPHYVHQAPHAVVDTRLPIC